jgi:hypothetical protein
VFLNLFVARFAAVVCLCFCIRLTDYCPPSHPLPSFITCIKTGCVYIKVVESFVRETRVLGIKRQSPCLESKDKARAWNQKTKPVLGIKRQSPCLELKDKVRAWN